MYLFTVGLDKSIPIRARGVANFWQWGHNSSVPRTCPFKHTDISITTQDITVSIPPPKNNINTGTEELFLKSKERLEKGDRTSRGPLPRAVPAAGIEPGIMLGREAEGSCHGVTGRK